MLCFLAGMLTIASVRSNKKIITIKKWCGIKKASILTFRKNARFPKSEVYVNYSITPLSLYNK
jgi:hypothetical protein